MGKVYNFNPGPAILPPAVLDQVQEELRDYGGRGMSIMEMSHRSKEYEAINASAEARVKRLLGLGDEYRVLFLQGGASTQFALIPLNFLPAGHSADYIVNGTWGEKALEDARKVGTARAAASTKQHGYRGVPATDALDLDGDAAYVHLTTNETIQGVQWHELPALGDKRLVADMSSDIMSRPMDATQFALIYAGAQKNLGPSGATVVIVRADWLEEAPESVPTMLRYATHAANNSLYNTPPVFAVYVLDLVLAWIEQQGGLAAMEQRNEAKARLLYDTIDASNGFYIGHAEIGSRSLMNVTFRLPDEAGEKRFLQQAAQAGFVGLPGHRSVGGVRASIYNAMDLEGVQALASFMREFAARG